MDTEESSSVTYNQLLQETLMYGKEIQNEFREDPCREVHKALEEAFSLIAYSDPLNAKEVSHLLDPSGRVLLAEEVNSAILRNFPHFPCNLIYTNATPKYHSENRHVPPSNNSTSKPACY